MPATDTWVRVGSQKLSLSNLEKLYWPEQGITKGAYLYYCHQVAPWMLPHLKNRPLVLTRYPDGIHGHWFYQKDAPDYTPEWVELFPYWSEDTQRWIRFIHCKNIETLIWIANHGALELHPWLSQLGSVEKPDFAVIDLDPAEGAGFAEACQAARLLRELLEFLRLRSYPKTTGATGLHLYIPLERHYDYRTTSQFVRQLGVAIRSHAPDLITLERSVSKRTGRVYVDYLQNVMGKTLVAAYSTRPRPQGTVSFPIDWDEVGRVYPEEFTIHTVPQLLERRGDRFAPVLADRQRLEDAFQRLNRLLASLPTGSGR